MKRFIFIVLIFSSVSSFGQRWKFYRHEFFFGGGMSSFFGDIGGAPDANSLLGIKDFRISDVRYTAFLAWNYRYTRDISVRYSFNYAALTGTDAGSKNAYRGLSFNTSLFELSAQGQYYFFNEYRRKNVSAMFNRRGMVASNLRYGLYGFAGIGAIYFDPKLSGPAELLNVDSKERKTAGYSRVNATIPFGVGATFSVGKRWLIGYEIGWRFALSDNIDGMWTMWSKSRDVYWFNVFYGVYKIKTDRYGYPILFGKHF